MRSEVQSDFTTPVAALDADARAAFIVRTYTHLFGAIVGFVAIQVFLFRTGMAATIAETLLGVNWLFVLGGFVVVSWFASRAANRGGSPLSQYAALGAFVLAEAIIFVPLLYVAHMTAGGGVIQSAALVTLIGFGALTGIVYSSRKDFSFLGGILKWGLGVALVLIVAGVIFGFQLGTFFSVAMIALAGGAILYDTSNILHHYPADRHVGAALALFASVALMFWYVLSLFLSRD
ncbi:MAG: permease [Rhodothermales bacterium]|nr:permease [Rhodothermales bacterium]